MSVFSHFFIDRPVFAWVIAIIIMLTGAVAITSLPVEQYPTVAPPMVNIRANYPGADAKTIENSVTQVIEQKLLGIDHLRYFESKSAQGSASITLTFEPGTDPDIAQIQTQNKIQSALPRLPLEVQQQGVVVTKTNSNFLLVVGFYSEDQSVSEDILGDLIVSHIQDGVSRVNGVGDTLVFGTAHAMRIWLNPHQLINYGMTANDVYEALLVQNRDISAGELGGLPAIEGQLINMTVRTRSRLQTPEEFERIVLRADEDGSVVLLRDVARVELGSERYDVMVRYKGLPAAGMAIELASGANAILTVNAVKEKVDELAKSLPEGIKFNYPYDTTPFIRISIKNVLKTLLEAFLLVLAVMFLFLQNVRATLIPAVAVPVVLLGTTAVLYVCGYSINILTLFAMILAIGLLVDDAIVVVENVERLICEEDLSPKEATRKSMQQITGALIGITLVLAAVFVPMGLFGGSAGSIYRQFSLTLVTAMFLSVIVAIVLSPSLCASYLKPQHGYADSAFFGAFNRFFFWLREQYLKGVSWVINQRRLCLGLYAGLGCIVLVVFWTIPTAFLPSEDQGMLRILVNTPVSSTLEKTGQVLSKIESHILESEAENVTHLFTVAGRSTVGSAQNVGMCFLMLKDWSERRNREQSAAAIAKRLQKSLSQFSEAVAYVILPPAIPELSNASGFDFQLLDRAGAGHTELMHAKDRLIAQASKSRQLIGVRRNGLDDVAEYHIAIDQNKASTFGVAAESINQTFQLAWGSRYVNDFIDRGRIKKVFVQAEAPYRMLPEDVDLWYVRNAKGEMVSLMSFTKGDWGYGSPQLERFNGIGSVNIQGAPIEGVSTGDAMKLIAQIVESLPQGFDIEWTGLSFEERLTGQKTPWLYSFSILIVFLSLAALYESWSIPFSVILSVPLGIIGTILATRALFLENDIYFQVAFVTAAGLMARNGIFIVEFAKTLHHQGVELVDAALQAAKMRFRPILMTSLTFILGVFPLAISSGAGAASQRAIGVGMIGGMVSATTLGILWIPMLFVIIQKISKAPNPPEESDEGVQR